MEKIVVIFAVCAVASGCATSQQQIDSHAPAMNSWMGAPIKEFLDMQGTPTAVVEKDNYQIYRFDASKTKPVTLTTKNCRPTNLNEPIDDYGRPAACSTGERPWYKATFACTYGLVVVEDVITDWSMNGNNCRMITVHGRADHAETAYSIP